MNKKLMSMKTYTAITSNRITNEATSTIETTYNRNHAVKLVYKIENMFIIISLPMNMILKLS